MTLFLAWIAFPLVLAVVVTGAGLAVERAARLSLPFALVPSLGLAVMIVVSQACTYWDATAELATPLVVAIALAGFVVGRERLRSVRPDGWALGAVAGVFAVFAAPVLLSGEATFAGYGVLGDTAIHFVLIDRLMEHGRNVSGLAPSSYRSALEGYFNAAYPTGAHTALGAARPLVGQDVAWVYQPFLAFLAALTAGVLYELAGSVAAPRFARAAVAFVSAQPALIFAYSLQGSIKEVATVWVIALLVAILPLAVATAVGRRRLVPLAIVTAAGLEVLGLAIAPWLGPILLAALAAVLWARRGKRLVPTAIDAAVLAAAVVALAYPALTRSKTFVSATKGVVTAPQEFGNLLMPLRKAQAFGIWPSGDYRLLPDPGDFEKTYILIGIVIVAALLGLAWCLRRRALLPLLFAGVSVVGWAYATARGSPWVDAKALMIVSGPVMFTAMLGPLALLQARRRPEAALLALVLAFGVLWSNALAYHDASLAPRDRLKELQNVGDRVDGAGPVLYPEFEEYAKHFLRDGDPTGWTEAWQPGAQSGPFGVSEDVDSIPTGYLLRFPTLVLRRSPTMSRPPAPYRLTWTGRYYEIWRRPQSDGLQVLAHLPYGNGLQPASRPRSCEPIRRLAARAAPDERLAFVERSPGFAVVAARGPLPRGWAVDGNDPTAVRTVGAGTVQRPLLAPPGDYRFWVGGNIGRRVSIALDGRTVGSDQYELSGRGQYVAVGEARVPAGRNDLVIRRGGGDLHPGNGGEYSLLGPVIAEPPGAQRREVRLVRPSAWRSLCGRRLDWVEKVRS